MWREFSVSRGSTSATRSSTSTRSMGSRCGTCCCSWRQRKRGKSLQKLYRIPCDEPNFGEVILRQVASDVVVYFLRGKKTLENEQPGEKMPRRDVTCLGDKTVVQTDKLQLLEDSAHAEESCGFGFGSSLGFSGCFGFSIRHTYEVQNAIII